MMLIQASGTYFNHYMFVWVIDIKICTNSSIRMNTSISVRIRVGNSMLVVLLCSSSPQAKKHEERCRRMGV